MKKACVILGLFVLVGAGCGRPYAVSEDKNAPQEKNKILILDHGLLYYFNVTKQNISKTPNGNLLVKVVIENEENTDVWCDVRVMFRGADGFEVDKTDWEPLLFHRRTETTIEKGSMSAQAVDYRIEIRNAEK